MRVLFAGTPSTAVTSLEALLASDHEVAAVLTRPDAPVGRRRQLTASPVALAASAAGIDVLKPASLRDDVFAAKLADLAVDAVAVVAYGALIPESLLAAVRYGWVNLHFSLLPSWRGAAPVQAAIRAGDDVTGARTFVIEKALDTGPILGTVTETIRPTDTAGELLERLADSGAQLLVATLDGLGAGVLHPEPQHGESSYAAKMTVADAEVDPTQPAFAVDRHIRSVTPKPGAWLASRWGKLRIGPVEPVVFARDTDTGSGERAGDMTLPPGTLLPGKTQVLLGTATDPVRLSTVQMPGKRAIPAADWARGVRISSGERIGVAQ